MVVGVQHLHVSYLLIYYAVYFFPYHAFFVILVCYIFFSINIDFKNSHKNTHNLRNNQCIYMPFVAGPRIKHAWSYS